MGHLGRDGPSHCSGGQPQLLRRPPLKPEPSAALAGLTCLIPLRLLGPFTASGLAIPVVLQILPGKPGMRLAFSHLGWWLRSVLLELSFLISAAIASTRLRARQVPGPVLRRLHVHISYSSGVL